MPAYGIPPVSRSVSATHTHTPRSSTHGGAHSGASRGTSFEPRATAPKLSEPDGGARHERKERGPAGREGEHGQDRELARKTCGLGEVVVGLAHALAREVPHGRRAAAHREPWRVVDPAAHRLDRAQQLEVLEQHVAVVAAGLDEHRAVHRGEPSTTVTSTHVASAVR